MSDDEEYQGYRCDPGYEQCSNFSNEAVERNATIKRLTAKIERQAALIEKLTGVLREAETWFREYGDMHAAKGPDASHKAARNYERADLLRAALAAARTTEPAP